MFPQLGSPLIAVTPVIGILHSERQRTPLSCSAVHSCAAWLQSCGSPGRLALHSGERMFCAFLFIVLRPGSPGQLWGSILGASNTLQRRSSRLCPKNPKINHYEGKTVQFYVLVTRLRNCCLCNQIERACTSVLTCRTHSTKSESCRDG
jgi:hypothetical protein